jgi:hypothetical protein
MAEINELPVFDFDQRLRGGMQFPARMSVLPLGERKLALVSPVPIDDGMAREIARFGEVAFLIAPNLLHHMYLADAIRRYPSARVLAPPGLSAKRAELSIHGTLDEPPPELTDFVDVLPIAGAPSMNEYVFFHRASATLVVTDLVFNIERPRGFFANLFLFLGGCHGRLAASRAWSMFVKDRELARASIERILSLPVRTLVMAHGVVVRSHARQRLAAALQARFMGRARLALPAAG